MDNGTAWLFDPYPSPRTGALVQMTSLGHDKPCPPLSADGPKPVVAPLALVSSRGDQPARGSVQPAWSVQPSTGGPAEQHQHSCTNLVLEDLIPVLSQIKIPKHKTQSQSQQNPIWVLVLS